MRDAILCKKARRPADCVRPDQIVGERSVLCLEFELRPLPDRRHLTKIKIATGRFVLLDSYAINNGPVNDVGVLLGGREQDRHLRISLCRLGPEATPSDPALMLDKYVSSACAGLRRQVGGMPERMDAVAGESRHPHTFNSSMLPHGK
jgi:hypothetical protein